MKSQPTQEYQHLNNMLPCLTPHCIRRERVFGSSGEMTE